MIDPHWDRISRRFRFGVPALLALQVHRVVLTALFVCLVTGSVGIVVTAEPNQSMDRLLSTLPVAEAAELRPIAVEQSELREKYLSQRGKFEEHGLAPAYQAADAYLDFVRLRGQLQQQTLQAIEAGQLAGLRGCSASSSYEVTCIRLRDDSAGLGFAFAASMVWPILTTRRWWKDLMDVAIYLPRSDSQVWLHGAITTAIASLWLPAILFDRIVFVRRNMTSSGAESGLLFAADYLALFVATVWWSSVVHGLLKRRHFDNLNATTWWAAGFAILFAVYSTRVESMFGAVTTALSFLSVFGMGAVAVFGAFALLLAVRKLSRSQLSAGLPSRGVFLSLATGFAFVCLVLQAGQVAAVVQGFFVGAGFSACALHLISSRMSESDIVPARSYD